MKLTYNEPEMKISRFSRDDIVTTSGDDNGLLGAQSYLEENVSPQSIQRVDFSELRFIL